MRAARYLGVAPWELENQASYWADRATAAETAESRQAAAAQRRAQRR